VVDMLCGSVAMAVVVCRRSIQVERDDGRVKFGMGTGWYGNGLENCAPFQMN
jgi:hypothetical protein